MASWETASDSVDSAYPEGPALGNHFHDLRTGKLISVPDGFPVFTSLENSAIIGKNIRKRGGSCRN